ncbi:MAG: acyl-CoA thioesterase II [Deltaproteobacteria bacterium]|nr:acyl-CoA thioesterase II [Deltaproteobacteria bacterium]
MSQDVLRDFVRVLSLEPQGNDVFLGESIDFGWGQVFGGQVLGQALFAAAETLPVASSSERRERSRLPHSLQAYFLRLGRMKPSIEYVVERVRDGRSFSTRRVIARQAGEVIFQCACSFQADEPAPFEHQDPMPSIAGPDGLIDERRLWLKNIAELPEPMHVLAVSERPVELRPVDPVDVLRPETKGVDHAIWMRTTGVLPEDPALHRAILAYCSDFSFVATALRPYGVMWTDPDLQVASLDHCMWFHRPFRMDDWLLHVMHSASAYGTRGFVRGSVFSRDGTLVASTTQEGLMRRRARPSG